MYLKYGRIFMKTTKFLQTTALGLALSVFCLQGSYALPSFGLGGVKPSDARQAHHTVGFIVSSDDDIGPDGLKRRGDGSIDDDQPGSVSSSDDIGPDGLKRRGDGSIDDDQPGSVSSSDDIGPNGLKLRGDGSVDDDQFNTPDAPEFHGPKNGTVDVVLGDGTIVRGTFKDVREEGTREKTRDVTYTLPNGTVIHDVRSEVRDGDVRTKDREKTTTLPNGTVFIDKRVEGASGKERSRTTILPDGTVIEGRPRGDKPHSVNALRAEKPTGHGGGKSERPEKGEKSEKAERHYHYSC